MTNKNVILSIDAATKTGWAIYKNGKIIKHGTKDLGKITRIEKYVNWLVQMIGENEVTHIAAEDIFKKDDVRKDTLESLSEMKGALKAVSSIQNIGVSFIAPLAVKTTMLRNYWYEMQRCKGVKDRRFRGKELMLKRVKNLGYTLENDKADDEADVIGILITYLQNNNIPVKHPK